MHTPSAWRRSRAARPARWWKAEAWAPPSPGRKGTPALPGRAFPVVTSLKGPPHTKTRDPARSTTPGYVDCHREVNCRARPTWRRHSLPKIEGVRCALILALAAGTMAPAQSIVNPNRVRGFVAQMDAGRAGEPALRCQVSIIKPSLNFSFRYQSGYMATVPMNQFSGGGHGWAMLTRITPQGGTRKPVYLITQIALPPVPTTNMEARVFGGYLLGEGAYDVRWIILDDAGRVFRKSWRLDVHLSHAERQVKVAMPPDTVWEFGSGRSRTLSRGADDVPPRRLTIFLHTAPLLPRRTRLRPGDMMLLMSTVSSLLERVPARSVRLVLFNLEQQKELYRKDGFLLQDMPQVSQAMTSIELGMVDFQVLQNKRGHVDLLRSEE